MAAPGESYPWACGSSGLPLPTLRQGAAVRLAEPCWPSGVQGGGSVWEVRGLRDCSAPARPAVVGMCARPGSGARLGRPRGVVGRSLTQASQLPHGEGGDYASGRLRRLLSGNRDGQEQCVGSSVPQP